MTKADFVSNLGDWNLFEIWFLGFGASISLCALRSTGVACITIRIRCSPLVTVHAPLHIHSINHSYRYIADTGEPVTGGAIDLGLDMDPVWKDHKGREFVHPLPGDLFALLHVPEDFYCLGPFADRIA